MSRITVADWRITVVRDKAFTARIQTASAPTDVPVRDWRFGHAKGDAGFEPADQAFPKDIREKCLSLVKTLGLQFGAINLAEDRKGQL